MNSPLHILILAAGKGKRMQSRLPKVLHSLLHRPMLHHLLDVARAVPHESLTVVVGHGEEDVRAACAEYEGLVFVSQTEQRGTAHAVRSAEPVLGQKRGHVLVLSGDVVLLRKESLQGLIDAHAGSGAACTVVTAEVDEPRGYGRILRDGGGVKAIREEADCSEKELRVREVNGGIYCFRLEDLFGAVGRVGHDNRQGEFYLTDAVGMLTTAPGGVGALRLDDAREMTGVNDRLALSEVERILQARVNRALMLSGVTMRAPETTFVDPHSRISPDVVIEGGCTIVDSTIGRGTHLKQGSYVESSSIGEDCSIGPFAHLRPGSRLEAGVKIGNFVEVKQSVMGPGSKASHLAYIGDAEVGADVNLGCGFITCNYDGFKKHKTVIEDGVFVGSDSQTVAPVRLGRGSYVASGTTVTRDVPAGALALSRGRQENKEGYADKLKKRKK